MADHTRAGIAGRILPLAFYRRSDVVGISRDLLGKRLLTRIGGRTVTGGLIVETEAYGGAADRASHAFGNRRTRRTEVMFRAGGVAYVYLCYGMHALLNVVTGAEGVPDAVLIRALAPTHGLALMRRRRGRSRRDRALAGGPGCLARALGVTVRHSGVSLLGPDLWLEAGVSVPPERIEAGPRVGVAYAGPDARRPWRFRWREGAEGFRDQGSGSNDCSSSFQGSHQLLPATVPLS